METIKATLWIYRIAFKHSTQLVRQNWAVVFAPLGFSVFLSVASIFLIPFGLVGGLLLLLASNACMSSGLHLLENILNSRRANFNDFLKGFTVYLWEIVRISFILWIPMMVVSSVLTPNPNGHIIIMFIQIALYIFLNAVPELIYQSRASGVDLLGASYHFIIENWAEWFAPNIIITFAGWALMQAINPLASVLAAPLNIFVIASLIGFFLAYLMIFRGLLFTELNDSNRRARIYRYKARDST